MLFICSTIYATYIDERLGTLREENTDRERFLSSSRQRDGQSEAVARPRSVATQSYTTQSAVSYTHLDVYKRQVLYLMGVKCG